MADKKEIAVVSEEELRNKIYIIRDQKVMIDFELAEIYGYSTTAFNQQVKNNIKKFEGEDFCFYLTQDEFKNLMSKNLTSSWGGRRKPPRVFTEQGIYMLMTVLRGDLATRQSRTLIRLFKQMKDYIIDSPDLIGQSELARLTMKNTADIADIKSSMATKDDLSKFMKSFMDNHIGKELLFMDGKTVESDMAYAGIYSQAKKTIFIVDNYIGLKTLLFLKDIKNSVNVTVFSDNLGKRMTKAEFNDFCKEYPGISVSFQKTCDKFHDRFVILDYGLKSQTIYHCGGSSKDGGTRTMVISKMENNKIFDPMIQGLMNNPALILK